VIWPKLGFPRYPFHVYRRPASIELQRLVEGDAVVQGESIIRWNKRPVCEVFVGVVPETGATLRVEALDARGEVLPGQRIDFKSAQRGHFQVAGICALRAPGKGQITFVDGVDQSDLVNKKNWKLIEVVGLPFTKGEMAMPFYSSQRQGLAPASLPGHDAATVRLEIARILQLPIPDTGITDIPTPSWPPPFTDQYLKLLRVPGLGPLRLIKACLKNCNDADPARMQADYIFEAQDLPGIRQLDGASTETGPDLTAMNIPVVATTILSTSSDSSAATALGYGTVDSTSTATREKWSLKLILILSRKMTSGSMPSGRPLKGGSAIASPRPLCRRTSP
jgi:hypothetical protein